MTLEYWYSVEKQTRAANAKVIKSLQTRLIMKVFIIFLLVIRYISGCCIRLEESRKLHLHILQTQVGLTHGRSIFHCRSLF